MIENNGRNPDKKRGRPKKETVRQIVAKGAPSRNNFDMHWNIINHIPEDLRDELLHLVDDGKTTLTVVAYVARFEPEYQRSAFQVLNRLGARGAKRYIESQTNPPTPEIMAERLIRWASKEFPTVTPQDLALGFANAVTILENR